MARFTTRLLGSVALTLAVSGCVTTTPPVQQPAQKAPDPALIEPTLRQAAMNL